MEFKTVVSGASSDCVEYKYFPAEVLMLILEQLDSDSLLNCMFVNRIWRDIARRVADHKKLWQNMVHKYVINRGQSFTLKSLQLSWRDIFEKSMMWTHCEKADIVLNRTYLLDNIKKINVYKDNLIVVSCSFVKYFEIATSQIRKEIRTKCVDFDETDELVMKVVHSRECYKKLYLFGKRSATDFNISKENETAVDGVMHYRLENNHCFVIDTRNILSLYKWTNFDWELKFVARYYGDPEATTALNVYEDEAYILLKWGPVHWANLAKMSFEKKLSIPMPQAGKEMSVYTKMFHKFGIVFGVNSEKKFRFDRFEYQKNEVYMLECPNLSCVTEHGELLLIGYADGKIELLVPRGATKDNIVKATLHVRELLTHDVPSQLDVLGAQEPYEVHHQYLALRKYSQPEPHDFPRTFGVVSLNVHEDAQHQHVFVSTHSAVFHLVVSHPNVDTYLFTQFPLEVPVPAE